MIVFFISNLKNSRIGVLIVQLRNDEEETFYMFA
jgi:ABC-type branched-subunit amino acid transport system permease subunit